MVIIKKKKNITFAYFSCRRGTQEGISVVTRTCQREIWDISTTQLITRTRQREIWGISTTQSSTPAKTSYVGEFV